MKEPIIENYFVDYLPGLIGCILGENPVPGMEGTVFTLQISITGEKDLTIGFTIRDAREIKATPGGLVNPMVAVQIPEKVLRPLVNLISSLTSRGQYDQLTGIKGSMDMEINLSDGQDLPVRLVINGAQEPNFRMTGSSLDLGRMMSGSIDPPRAFMQGLIKLYGDLPFALQLSQLVRKKS